MGHIILSLAAEIVTAGFGNHKKSEANPSISPSKSLSLEWSGSFTSGMQGASILYSNSASCRTRREGVKVERVKHGDGQNGTKKLARV